MHCVALQSDESGVPAAPSQKVLTKYRCRTKHEIPAAQNRAFLKQISSKKYKFAPLDMPQKFHFFGASLIVRCVIFQ
jgi:hypothetical protein